MASDDEETSISVKERARLLNSQPPGQQINFATRTKSAPAVEEEAPPLPERPVRPALLPNLGQFGAKSEEFLQATKSGVVDLAGKGKVGFMEATGSIKGFIDRPRWPPALNPKPREATVMDFSFREEAEGARETVLDDIPIEEGTEGPSSISDPKAGPKWKLPEFDRQAVDTLSFPIKIKADTKSD
jgi:hypothetical protein